MDCDGEIKMWRAVIRQAMTDALDKARTKHQRAQAFHWFYGGNPDFQTVCDLARVSPNAVRKGFLEKRIKRIEKRKKLTN
jgi:hypothetical protein